MSAPRRVSRQQLRDNPYFVWNEYVGLLAHANCRDLTETQRVAYLVFWYEHEVRNGGHLQCFENRGAGDAPAVVEALRRLGAACQADVLLRAAARYTGTTRPALESVHEYVEAALGGEFDDLDQEFSRCEPTLVKALQNYLAHNQREFVMIEE